VQVICQKSKFPKNCLPGALDKCLGYDIFIYILRFIANVYNEIVLKPFQHDEEIK
jgi:hypothetical protein